MEYQANVKISKGKISVKASGDIEFLGFRFKVKEYQVEGDLNDTLNQFSDIISSGSDSLAQQKVAEILAKTLGINKTTLDKLKKALTGKI